MISSSWISSSTTKLLVVPSAVVQSNFKEFAKPEEFADKLLLCMEHDVQVTINMVLVPEWFERDWDNALFFHEQGIKFKMESKVNKVKSLSTGVSISYTDLKNSKDTTEEFDKVLVSVGRKPYTEGLNLAKIGIKKDSKGRIEVNSKLQTTIKNIYAIGDVIKGPMLAHKAEEEGIAVAEILAGQAGHVNYDVIPGVIYTSPEVATVGKTEEQLKEEKKSYKTGKFPFLANSRAKVNNETEGFVKILADAKTDKVLGVHIIGPHCGDMIAEMALAMEFGASAEDIARTCHAHPTHTEAIKEAALAVDKRPIHF